MYSTMYLNGLHLHLIRRKHMWHLKLHTDKLSLLTQLECSSSIKSAPRIVSVRRRNQLSILHLTSTSFEWLITIFHNSNQTRLVMQTLPCTASLDTLRFG
ncbi:NSs protein [Thimiri virus]|uniref:Non-structural protein NS-S n=1 Tax=Orthobunyavirus thimiriense TaxID=3052449 RepID=A0A346JEZ8_9VIRU|nr:NSs protein [Orthobunyavirus thimiriense]AXP32073.1 NSs protein [Orthobunyavirus thimiriense]